MQKPKNPVARRAGALLAFFMVGLAGLAGQLGNLTFRQHQAFAARADDQRTRTLPVFAPRGAIFDRDMQPLAINRPAYMLLVHYPHYKDPALQNKLAQILGKAPDEVQEIVKRQVARPYQPVKITDSLTGEQYAHIAGRRPELPGVEVQVQPVRHYPQGELAAHIMGYVGEISEEELEEYEGKGYLRGELVGQRGLEAFYEEYLHGKPGARQVEVNINAEPLGEAEKAEPQPGKNLVLTIDSELQRVAERALDWQMFRIQTIPNPGDGHAWPNAKAGAVVVMDVKTGAILAVASRPTFDPNQFIGGISTRDWNAIRDNPFHPLLNRSVQATYHPGSTWKMLTGAAALATGVTNPHERVFSGREYEPTGQRDWLAWGHGWVDLADALRVSSDIYFYEIGRRLGIEKQVEYAKGFGFGQPAGVDLFEEVEGFLPDAPYREEHGWWLGQTTSAAIGQIFTTTPLQLARYTAALANGGKLMKPYLVQSIRGADGKVIRETVPEATATLPVSQEAIRAVVEGMKRVNSPTGTSDYAIWPLPGIPTAGKTGTAENPPYDDYGLFVAFAPANNPEIAVAAVIEQAGHGGSVSPVSRSIFAEYFKVELPKNDPARVPDTFQPAGRPKAN